jgi:Fe-S-cluster-containing dehydrogenase component/CRP-like cAMP-binding protein
MVQAAEIDRPDRWSNPLDPTMSERDLNWVLQMEPFASMDRNRFGPSMPLLDILRYDSRISRYEHGDIIVREGEYGSHAFIVLRGQVRVLLTRLLTEASPTESRPRPSWWKALRDSLKSWPVPEVRTIAATRDDSVAVNIRTSEDRPRIFIQDATAVLDGCESEKLGPGELFGEIAAMTRSSSAYTVVAEGPIVIMEIRWQGLRLLRRDPHFQAQLDRRYREASLKTHLRETLLFRFLPPEQLDKIAEATQLKSFGDREWFADYQQTKKLNLQERIAKEPLIVAEASPVNWLVLIRSGFARVSTEHGYGHQTLSYLGRGQHFGLPELVHNVRPELKEDEILPYQESLRGIGFVDVLMIPRREFVEHALPFIRSSERPPSIVSPRYDALGPVIQPPRSIDTTTELETAFVEFLVDHRLMNGRQTMVIDTERCTRCDDCVRACARTHQGNPRFVRHGPQFDRYQFTKACMHCTDPVCMIGCPTGAISRHPQTGNISINPSTCIGCKVCAESCPYDNIVMVALNDAHGRKLVDRESQLPILQATKCDLCQDQPHGPACQLACPHEALVRLDLTNLSELERWTKRRAA